MRRTTSPKSREPNMNGNPWRQESLMNGNQASTNPPSIKRGLWGSIPHP